MAAAKGSSALFSKLARISGELGRVAKNGRNDHHGYDYVTETDLVEAVRAKLAAAGVAYFFSVRSVVTREVETMFQDRDTKAWLRSPAKAGAITEVMVEVTFADGESGETFSVSGAGAGQDAGDKGVYKALTGAQKYVLMKTFLIATGDDPEGDTKVDEANTAPAAAPTTKPAAKPAPVSKKKDAAPAVAAAPTTAAPAAAAPKTEAVAHTPKVNATGGEEQDPMTKVLPGGPMKGRTIGSLNLEEAEGLLKVMPSGNSWTTHVTTRRDYLKTFETMPEALKETANELDLELDKKLAAQE